MRRASRQAWCEAPRPHSNPHPGGGRVGRSTEAIAQPVARRPERSEGTRPKNLNKSATQI
ncbi:MAG: hypothetical protein NZ455_00260 [Bacteroidia bacterium]|nr:hypothetical protein [Bacteroidia bacterium]MDW8347348.1 hypothetical protein [Bacteroidia bacterium]